MKKWIALATGLSLVLSGFAAAGFQPSKVQAADRTGFVQTDGTQFLLDGSTFYYAGTNNYYLNFKPQYEVDQVMEDAAAMGLKVIRTWGNLDAGVKTDKVNKDGYTVFTDSVDGSGEKEGVYYQYFDADLGRPVVNEGKDGLQKLDYAIYKAEQEGVRLLITFTNNWEAFGGMNQYVKWAKLAGENVTGHDDFYTNETIKGWYKDYIKTLLNHENVYTGVKYKDDPTIFSWELANEPRCESDAGCENHVVENWASEMSAYVKSIDSNHMLAVGDEGFYNYGYNDFPEGDHKYVYHGSSGMDWLSLTNLPNIDYGTIHVYCDQWGLTKEQGNFWFKKHGEDAAAMNKPVIVEEFGWKDKSERADVYNEWFDIFEGNTYEGVEYAGTNYWMLASLTGDGTLYQDYDGYTVYYKGDANGNPTQDACDAIMAHAQRMDAKNTQNSVSPKKANFDIVKPADIQLRTTMELGSVSGVQFGDKMLTEGTDYTVEDNVITISAVIGMTSWTSIAKVVRTEVRQIRNSEYVIASRCMGGSFFYILWHHLAPNFFSSIMFMVVMNIRSAIVAESTLSFMGIGLPLEVISWGSMLSLSEKALMTKAWWIILIPGVFLIVTLLSFTSIGNYLRKQANRKQRNL